MGFHWAQDITPSKKVNIQEAHSTSSFNSIQQVYGGMVYLWPSDITLQLQVPAITVPHWWLLEVEEQGQPYTHPVLSSSLHISYGLLLEVLYFTAPVLMALYF